MSKECTGAVVRGRLGTGPPGHEGGGGSLREELGAAEALAGDGGEKESEKSPVQRLQAEQRCFGGPAWRRILTTV